MQITALLTTLLFTTAVIARGDKGDGQSNGNSIKSQCRQIEKLTDMVEIANNQTLLDAKSKGNTTKADAFKAKAAEASTQLTTLKANQTLMTTCGQIQAQEDMQEDCGRQKKLQRTIALAANQTALDAKFKGNATKIAEFQAKASSAVGKVNALASNATLQQYCSVLTTQSECKQMTQVQKMVALAANQTALDAKFKGNATKIAAFQAKASEASTKIQAMSTNTTLTNICSSLAQAKTSGSQQASTDSNKLSAAPMLTSSSGVMIVSAGLLAVALNMLI